MKIFISSLIYFFFSLHSHALSKKMVILGDSLTEGYGVSRDSAFPSLLEKKIQASKKDWTVVNAGISGSTSASGVGRIRWMLHSKKDQRPDLIVLILGANDGLRGLRIEQTEKNLAAIIELVQKEKIKIVLGGLYMPPNYGKKYTDDFKKIYQNLAAKYKVPLIPFLLKEVAGNSKLNLADGIHPNEEGHRHVADNVYSVIKDLL